MRITLRSEGPWVASTTHDTSPDLFSDLSSIEPERPTRRLDFEIAIFCTLELEADILDALFDNYWDDDGPRYDKAPGDPNYYRNGSIGRRNVVLVYMPEFGEVNASASAAHCRNSYPNIKLAIFAGICGAVPFGPGNDEIVLGDVVLSTGIVRGYGGRQLPKTLLTKDGLLDSTKQTHGETHALLEKLKGIRGRNKLQSKIVSYLGVLQDNSELRAKYPGTTKDRLFNAEYRHISDGASCEECGCFSSEQVPRRRLGDKEPLPAVHFGLIASIEVVMKSGEDRDIVAQGEGGILGFKFGAAGVWDSLPCVVIAGACDYADSHKTKVWQRYAAASAAACTKALIELRSDLEQLDMPMFLVPFPRNKNFVGRTAILERLQHQHLEPASPVKTSILGLGGVGKTQIALEYVYWLRETYPTMSIFWVHAHNAKSFHQAYTSIAQGCQIPRYDEPEVDTSVLVKDWLESPELGQWLMVIDNADDPELFSTLPSSTTESEGNLARYLPDCVHGSLLITTRNRQVGVRLTKGQQPIEVPLMNIEESEKLLRMLLRMLLHSRTSAASAELRTLSSRLENHPLALVLGACYMERTGINAHKFLQVLGESAGNMLGLYKTAFSSVMLTLQQVQEEDTLAIKLLSLMSLLDPHDIPIAFLEHYSQKERNGGPTSKTQLARSIGALKASSLVTGNTSGSLEMHRVVQEVVRHWLRAHGTLAEFEREAAALLDPGGEGESSMESQSDIESIFSSGSTTSTRSSAHASKLVDAAISLSIRLLLEDTGLKVLYPTAITKVGISKFQRNFDRMLKSFGDRLRAKAINEPQRQAALFLRNSRREITAGIREEIAPGSGVLRTQAMFDSDARARLMNKWLESQNMNPEDPGHFRPGTGRKSQTLGEIGQLGGHDGLDESDSDDEESQLASLEEVKLFLTSSEALSSLRSDFQAWLRVDTDRYAPMLGSERGDHANDARALDTATEHLDARTPSSEAKDQPSPQAGKGLNVDYYIKERSQSAILRDSCKILFERAIGCRVSWWPLAQPEEELVSINTRVYSQFPCGWAFYNDIPTSVAKVWFPKLDGDNQHSSNADGKSSHNAVFLQNTTLLRCLSSESGLRQRAHGFENVPIGPTQAVKLLRDGHRSKANVTPELEAPQPSLDPSRRSNVNAENRSPTPPSQDPAEPTIFLTVNINPKEKAAYARSIDQGVNDVATLKGLRSAYYKLRTGWWQQPTGVRFYRFHSFLYNQKQSLHRISLHRDKERYPEEVDHDYVYNPRPWPSDFPFPKDEVWHFFAHPQECGTATQINDKLPVRKSKVACSQVQAFGVHIEEGLNNFAITLVGIFILAITFGSTLWFLPYWLEGHQDDLQNATVPVMVASSVVLAVSQVLVTLLLFKYTVAA